MYILNFGEINFENKNSKVLCGSYTGIKARNFVNIEKIFKDNDIICFKIPDSIFAITPSFLTEFLKPVILKYGYSIFDKIVLCKENTYDAYPVLQEVINRLLVSKNLR